MKAKEILYYLGWKPKAKTYAWDLSTVRLPTDGDIQFAQWLHPRYPREHFTQAGVDALRQFLKPGDFALDIGAHTGDSTVPIALAVGNTGAVLAFEPNRYVFPVLEKNATLNPAKTRILPIPFAAATADCEMEFEYSDAGFCNGGSHEGLSSWRLGHAFKLKVQGRNVPQFLTTHHAALLPKLHYIKVDAEGYDHTILQTLTGLLKSTRPFIKAEVFKYTTEDQRRQFLAFLNDLGYRVHRILDDSHLEGPPLTESNLMERRHYDIFCAPK